MQALKTLKRNSKAQKSNILSLSTSFKQKDSHACNFYIPWNSKGTGKARQGFQNTFQAKKSHILWTYLDRKDSRACNLDITWKSQYRGREFNPNNNTWNQTNSRHLSDKNHSQERQPDLQRNSYGNNVFDKGPKNPQTQGIEETKATSQTGRKTHIPSRALHENVRQGKPNLFQRSTWTPLTFCSTQSLSRASLRCFSAAGTTQGDSERKEGVRGRKNYPVNQTGRLRSTRGIRICVDKSESVYSTSLTELKDVAVVRRKGQGWCRDGAERGREKERKWENQSSQTAVK